MCFSFRSAAAAVLVRAAALRRGHEGVGLWRHRFFARKSGEKTRKGQAPCPPHCQPLRKRYCTRCAKECVQFLIAAFDLVCFLRPLPLCGGVSEVRLLGKRIARVKCTQSCTAAGTKSPPCGLPINRSAERCRSAARGRPLRACRCGVTKIRECYR